jgi:nitrogen fixation NifU-like protein
MDLYAYQILDHYKQPRNYGVLEGADASSEQANLSCGDKVMMYVKVADGAVTEIKFTGDGCAISKASTSMLTEKLIGRRVEDVLAMDLDSIREILGIEISDRRSSCALIGLSAIQASLKKIAK